MVALLSILPFLLISLIGTFLSLKLFFFFLNNDGKLIIVEKEFVFLKPKDKFTGIAKFAQIWQ